MKGFLKAFYRPFKGLPGPELGFIRPLIRPLACHLDFRVWILAPQIVIDFIYRGLVGGITGYELRQLKAL